MRWTRRNHRKALKALALALATSAVVAGTASAAQVHDGGTMVTPKRRRPRSRTQLRRHGRDMRPFATQQSEIAYLSWGATARTRCRFRAPARRAVFMNGLPDGYVGSQTTQGGVTPTNLARAYVPQVQGVSRTRTGTSRSSAALEELVIRDTPDGFQPQTKDADVVSISADSSTLEAGDLALGFGLGLILATAGAIALAMSRNRERVAHS